MVSRVRAYSDWLVIGGILAAGAVDLLAIGQDFQGSKAANALVIVACVAPLYWRRREPVLTLFAVIAASNIGGFLLYGADEQGPIEPWLCLLVALYSLGAYESRRHVIQALAVALPIGLAQSIVSQVAGMQAGDVWPSYLFYAIAVGTGRAMRHYRGLTAELRERTVELEREREETARLAVLEERSRVARELHDVIAHSVSVIVVQAAAERRRAARRRRRDRGGARPDRAHRARGAGRAAAPARRVAPQRRRRAGARAAAGAGRARRARGAGARRRAGGRRADRGLARGAARGSGPVGVPDRPGGAH